MPITRYLNFGSGQNNQTNNFLKQKSELNLMKNANVELVGAIQKDNGYLIKGAQIEDGYPVDGLHADQFLANVVGLPVVTLYAKCKAKFWKFVSGTWTAETGEGANLTASISSTPEINALWATLRWKFTTFYNKIYAVNGYDYNRVKNSNGSTWATFDYGGANCACRVLRFINPIGRRLFAIPVARQKRIVYSNEIENDGATNGTVKWGFVASNDGAVTSAGNTFTSSSGYFKTNGINPGDPLVILAGYAVSGQYQVVSVDSETQLTVRETFSSSVSSMDYEVGGNWFEPGGNDNSVCWGAYDVGGAVIAVKADSIHKFDGVQSYRIGNMGAVNDRVIQVIDGVLVWANQKGIYTYQKGTYTEASTDLKFRSYRMQKWFNAADRSKTSEWFSWQIRYIYHVFIGDVTVDGVARHNVVIKYDLVSNAFSFSELPVKPRSFMISQENGLPTYYLGDDDGRVYTLDSGLTFNGTPIPMEVVTTELDLDYPEQIKIVKRIIVFSQNAGGTIVMIRVDGGTWETVGRLQNRMTVFTTKKTGALYEVYFAHADLNTQPIIDALIFDWEDSGQVGTVYGR